MKTIITLEVTHAKPIPDLVAKIEGRAYTLDGVEDVRQVNQWLPIESAPKDGAEILVYVAGDSLYPTAASFKSRQYFEKEYGDPEYMDEGWYWAFGYPSDFHEETINPTHWMPLPAAPEPKEQTA